MKRSSPSSLPVLLESGQMRELFAKTNWSKHQLGPIEKWPTSLQTAVGSCLSSPFPMAVYWGIDMHILYNDTWAEILGDKHPQSFASPAELAWAEVWSSLAAPIKQVRESGKGLLLENVMIPTKRHGFIEERYFDYTYNPIYGEDQSVVGVLCVYRESTSRVIAERRSEVILKLSRNSITAESPEAACILLANTLSEAPADIPFALLYLLNPEETAMRLAATTSIDPGSPIADETVYLRGKAHALTYRTVIRSKTFQLINNLDRTFELPGGIWDEPGRQAVLAPIIRPQSDELYGVMLLGLSPRSYYDKHYEIFLKRVAEQAALAIGNAFDLSRRLALEAREHDAREQLNTALSGGAISIWSWDIQSDMITADKNLAKRLGVNERKARQGLPFSKFVDSIHPEDRKNVLIKIKSAVKHKKGFEAEYRLVGRDHSIRWVIARGKVESDSRGVAARLPGVIVDITRRKDAERKLASSQLMFKALFESSIIGVAVASLGGQIKEANESFLSMFQYTRKDLTGGLSWEQLTPANLRPVANAQYRDLKHKGETEPTEKDYVRKDGTVIPVLVGEVMIPGSSDTFISYTLDISEQRQLVALNKAKDEFISIASHQLRTPATGVKQYLGMVLEGYVGTVTKAQHEIIKTAYDSNERQLTIVNDLLRVAQADASSIKLIPAYIKLDELIADVIHEQNFVFAAKSQEIIFNPPKTVPQVILDPFHIRMLFENLIDNASKYTPYGKKITVTLEFKHEKVVVSVKDEGVGIRKKDLSKLFKKFSRIDNPLSTPGGGTGLGLYWVHKIIEMHKGTIEVHSEYRKGTEFVITLPTDINKQ